MKPRPISSTRASSRPQGNLPEVYEAFWAFYGPLKLGGLLPARLKELVRLKIAELNECAT